MQFSCEKRHKWILVYVNHAIRNPYNIITGITHIDNVRVRLWSVTYWYISIAPKIAGKKKFYGIKKRIYVHQFHLKITWNASNYILLVQLKYTILICVKCAGAKDVYISGRPKYSPQLMNPKMIVDVSWIFISFCLKLSIVVIYRRVWFELGKQSLIC